MLRNQLTHTITVAQLNSTQQETPATNQVPFERLLCSSFPFERSNSRRAERRPLKKRPLFDEPLEREVWSHSLKGGEVLNDRSRGTLSWFLLWVSKEGTAILGHTKKVAFFGQEKKRPAIPFTAGPQNPEVPLVSPKKHQPCSPWQTGSPPNTKRSFR